MKSITFGQCVEGAWHDGWRYLQKRPVVVFALFLIAWLASIVETALLPDQTPPFRFITYVPLVIFELVRIALFSILTVQALRFWLLGNDTIDDGLLFSRNYWRYVGLAYGLIFVSLLLIAIGSAVGGGLAVTMLVLAHSLLVSHPDESLIVIPIMVGTGTLIAAAISFLVVGRLNLLCVHVAIGGAEPLGDIWARTHGHGRTIMLTQVTTLLPMFAAWLIFRVIGGPATVLHPTHLEAFGEALGYIALLCVGAACSAWLYRRYVNVFCLQTTQH